MSSVEQEIIQLAGDAGGGASAAVPAAGAGDDEFKEDRVDTSAGEPPVAESAPSDADEVKARRVLSRRISRYTVIFPEEVSDIAAELENLHLKSPEELQHLLDEVTFLVETRRSSAQSRGLFLAALSVGEAGGGLVGLKLAGLSHFASQSADLLTCVDEVSLKYSTICQLDPISRLSLSLAQLVVAVDASNRAREASTAPVATAAPLQPPPAGPTLAKTTPDGEQTPAGPTGPNKNRAEFSDL